MPFVVQDETYLLQNVLGSFTSYYPYYCYIYINDPTPNDLSILSDLTFPSNPGSGPITLSPSSWSYGPGLSEGVIAATYPMLTWTIDAASSPINIYGVALVDQFNSGLIALQNFSDAPLYFSTDGAVLQVNISCFMTVAVS